MVYNTARNDRWFAKRGQVLRSESREMLGFLAV